MTLLLLLLACGGDDTDTDATPFTPTVPAGSCGRSYDWAPLDDMGTIVEWEYSSDLSMDSTSIDAYLLAAGAEAFVPAPYGVEVYRVRYLTQDRGEVVEATAWVSFPDVDGEQEVPSLMWAHGTSGFTDICAPTAHGIEGAGFNIILSSQGFAVVAPDYLGMNGWGEPAGFLHPYITPEPTAVACLDSLRALWRFQEDSGQAHLDATPSRQTVLWGGSEGGFAALWSDRYAEHYLPEAELVATIASVPPTDVRGLAVHGVTHFGPTTGALGAMLATNNAWNGHPADLSEVLTDDATHSLASSIEGIMATECGDGGAFDDITTVEQVYQPEYIEALQSGDDLEPWTCYLDRATLTATDIPRTHDTPLFFQVSELDDLVVGSIERADFPSLCAMGYRANYLECAGMGHTDGAVASIPQQWAWLQARLAGEEMTDVCVQGPPVECEGF